LNIFILHNDPVLAARQHCDKHCVKMVAELFQQLGSAARRHGATDDMLPLTKRGTPLRGGYHNHPCTRWVGASSSNYEWAVTHALALCDEYTFRYGRRHFCESGIRELAKLQHLIPSGDLTRFALAMPQRYHHLEPVEAYCKYYIYEKAEIAVWAHGRPAPEWWPL